MFALTKILPMFVYPVGLAFLLCLLCLLAMLMNRQRLGVFFVLAAMVVMGAASNPLLSHLLVRSLEVKHPPEVKYQKVSAIVLLGGGEVPPVAPRLYPEVSDGDRIMHAARLYSRGYAPYIIATGGKYFFSEYEGTAAGVMSDLLAASFGVPRGAMLLEDKSRNTYEHGPNVKAILEGRGLSLEVILVTSAMHMPRAVKVFEKQGFKVHPASTDFLANKDFEMKLTSFIPNAGSLETTTRALHEYYGLLAYRIAGWI